MFRNSLSSYFGAVLNVTAGFGVALTIGANAVAICPAHPAVIGQLVTTLSCSASSACVSGPNTGGGPGVSGASSQRLPAASSSDAGAEAVS